jgi:hypothetical protein
LASVDVFKLLTFFWLNFSRRILKIGFKKLHNGQARNFVFVLGGGGGD